MPQQGEGVAALLDTWVGGLSKALTPTTAKRINELPLKPGAELKLDRTNKATSADGVVWVDLWSGSVLFDDVSTLVFPRKRAFFPITPDSWIRPLGDEFGELVLNPKKTDEVVADANFWLSLQVFHRALCECEFVNKKLANVDEYVRLQAKAHHKEAAEEAAYDAIGAVMRTESDTPRELLDAVGSEPVLKACALVGHAFGIEVRGNPGATEDLAYEEQVAAIAASSGFRTRLVMLRDDWWNYDHGPLLGQHAETRLPVALLPTGHAVLRVHQPEDRRARQGQRQGRRDADAVRVHVLPAVPGRIADRPAGRSASPRAGSAATSSGCCSPPSPSACSARRRRTSPARSSTRRCRRPTARRCSCSASR